MILGATVVYWVTAPIVGIVEHDAYILTLLYVIVSLVTCYEPAMIVWVLPFAE